MGLGCRAQGFGFRGLGLGCISVQGSGFFCFGALGVGLDSNLKKVREAQEAGEL